MRFSIVQLLTEMRSLIACRRGQIAIIFAFALAMLIVAVGMGIDMWRAYAVQARLQSAVDAAALALASTDRTKYVNTQDPFLVNRVKSYVKANFPAAALGTPGTPILSYGATNDIIIVSDTASVPTTFMGFIGKKTLSVSATGQAKAAWSNIDFYLLLDSSPSMGIAANQAGINQMVMATSGQGGCAFACHETNPYITKKTSSCSSPPCNDLPGNPGCSASDKNPAVDCIDNYQLSKNLGVQLRIDDLRTAVAQLMTTAQNTETKYNLVNAFRMAIYTFDVNFNTIQTIAQFTSLSASATAANNIQQLTMYYNGWLTSTNNNNDAETDYTKAMTQMNAIMPQPGHGTKSPGDTPKEVLFLVTDGLVDEINNGCVGSATVKCDGNRQMSVVDTTLCDAIKNKGGTGNGPLIATLYLEYGALPTNSFYNTWVAPYNQPAPPTGIPPTTPTAIETAMQNCASSVATGPLYAKVVQGGDISATLSNLFNQAVNAVYLSK